jgi:hypothetical protein
MHCMTRCIRQVLLEQDCNNFIHCHQLPRFPTPVVYDKACHADAFGAAL